ncbi:MAG: hypothetical protein V1792_19240 [Pseudomonadota bacterium]
MSKFENREAWLPARVTGMTAHKLRNVPAAAKEYTQHMEDMLAVAGLHARIGLIPEIGNAARRFRD